MKQKYVEIADRIATVCMPVLLVFFSLMLIDQGLTVTDTGYNYGNFTIFDSLDNMWKFSTFLATALGAFFTQLPMGHTVLGLNLYTGLIKAAIAVVTYLFCVRSFRINKYLVFVAELFALGYCWCPTALIYNYLTYFLFTLGAILLCVAVEKEKSYLYILAGVCLGANVMVRLPNLAEMALIVPLWCICFFKKLSFVETLKRTGLCVLGYALSIGIILGSIMLTYGAQTYIDAVSQLLSMPSEAGGYSVKMMLLGDIRLYIENLKWVAIAIGFILAGMLLYRIYGKRFLTIKRILFVLSCLGMLVLFYYMGLYQLQYYDYSGVYFVGMVFLIVSGLMALYVMFFGKDDYAFRMHAMVAGVVILISPLGSNNNLFTAVNNLFIVTPFTFLFLARLWKKKEPLLLEPLKICVTVFILFALLQGVLFGSTFVFRDGIYGEKRTETIENNPVLANMKTMPQNGNSLNALNEYLVQNGLKYGEAILYDNVPGLCFYMELEPALSTTWPDLDSFVVAKFEHEIQEVSDGLANGQERPLVITGSLVEPDKPKTAILHDFLEKHDYKLEFQTEGIFVYR